MVSIFKNPPKGMTPFKQSIKAEAENIVLFFDGFVREAVEAMVGITPKNVGKRYIERKILDLAFELEKVNFRKTLRKITTEHLTKKSNDYDFVTDAFSLLWKECGLDMEYSNFLKISEPPLHNIFTKANQQKPYRDHYLHQFQVFLLGVYIIDKLRDRFPSNIEKQWLISSSFHDMAYPIQLYDNWAKDFFNESLGIPEIGVADMKSHFVDKTLLSCMGDIINLLCKLHFKRDLKGNWLSTEKNLVKFFHDKITKLKHHCVLGSIFLLKKAEDSSTPQLLNDLFIPSALTIALHHDVVWEELFQQHKLKKLKFEDDPLSFLLLYCDAAQEWGRPKEGILDSTHIETEDESFILDEFTVNKSKCTIIISSLHLDFDHPILKKKNEELEKLKSFLQPPPDIEFKITLKDKSNTKREYLMIGGT